MTNNTETNEGIIPSETHTPTAISISYTPTDDETYIAISTSTIKYLMVKVPKALVPAAYNAAQICNGNPIPPNEKVVIHTNKPAGTEIATHIFIGPV
ncbi:hypothetical protein [Pseudomonas putida]|uniref:hypothetical protein n=1 Tax=Pseudomonas putida TaxID=303 RepID=UPI00301C5417